MSYFIISFLFISIFGTISHFIYEWSNNNKIAAIFFPVNESVWEHIKMLITPTIIWLLILLPYLYDNPNYIFASMITLLSEIILIPLIFYSYTFFTKKSILIIDILSFYLIIFISIVLFYLIIKANPVSLIVSCISFLIIIKILILYLTLTKYPLKCFLFQDSITKKYGLNASN